MAGDCGWGLSERHRGLRDWVEEKKLVQSWTLSKPLKSADSLRTYIPDILVIRFIWNTLRIDRGSGRVFSCTHTF